MIQHAQNKGLMPPQMLVEIEPFISKIQSLSALLGLNLQGYEADHIALRVNDEQVAQVIDQAWSEYGDVISRAHINGRPIVVIALTQPIEIEEWRIKCLELPYPAVNKTHPVEGWEHVEFVVPSDAETAQDYLAYLQQHFPELDCSEQHLEKLGIKMKLSSPKGEGERLANPTVAFKHQGICIKLHPHSLADIVASEQG
ncbi:VOC family protein [Vibrio hippocampi]|uniref:Protein YecM n=1 Tax=Vibrio hippocampi TaxID=654686 RepID=A0ABN8DEM5_9VIBR|nr:VOC family protein [Vibrio hippocampi]CAH0525127.1 Protein YecM [Vibrio hippocampi]